MKIDNSNTHEMTNKIKKAAKWFGADMVGICKLDKRWVYSHTAQDLMYLDPGDGTKHASGESIPQEIPEEFQYAVVMCYEMDYNVLDPLW